MDTWRWRAVAAAGLSLAAMAFWRLGEAGRAIPLPRAPVPVMRPLLAPLTPSAEARRDAMRAWWSAQNAVNREREAPEDWDPAVEAPADQETGRRRLMAGSRRRDLQRAAAAAARAVALARTPSERFAASELAWRIAADRDGPRAELAAARLLVRLDRRSPVSLQALRHAALASGRRRLARQADAALRALQEGSARGLGVGGSAVSAPPGHGAGQPWGIPDRADPRVSEQRGARPKLRQARGPDGATKTTVGLGDLLASHLR